MEKKRSHAPFDPDGTHGYHGFSYETGPRLFRDGGRWWCVGGGWKVAGLTTTTAEARPKKTLDGVRACVRAAPMGFALKLPPTIDNHPPPPEHTPFTSRLPTAADVVVASRLTAATSSSTTARDRMHSSDPAAHRTRVYDNNYYVYLIRQRRALSPTYPHHVLHTKAR